MKYRDITSKKGKKKLGLSKMAQKRDCTFHFVVKIGILSKIKPSL